MARQYYGILTTKGRALYANALLLNQDVNLSEMAIDDTVNFLPDEKLESLPSEVYRAELNSLEKDEDNDEMVIAELVIPSQRGGFYCRGFGLYTDTGILFAVGSLAETYKATEDEGSGGELVIQADIVVTNTAALVLKVDPTTVLATRETVERAIAAHEAKLDPHPQYAPKNSPTLTGIPKAPTPPAGNNTTQIATTAFVQEIATALNTALALKAPLASPGLTGTPTAPTAAQSTNNTQIATTAFVKSAIAALVASSPAALDTLNELAAALGNDPNFATTMTNALAGKQPLDSTLTNLSGKDVAGLLSY
ncbi:phage tail protein, partial [Salmonella enterica]|nr:phage tail protein [Salmonella enterica]